MSHIRPPTEQESTCFYDAYHYAREILKGPWKEKEDLMMHDPFTCYLYARDALKWSPKYNHFYIRSLESGMLRISDLPQKLKDDEMFQTLYFKSKVLK